MDILITGFLTSAMLIIAIGAQNAFILKNGISNNHIFTIASVCFLCDVILISIGVLGIGKLIIDSIIAKLGLSLLGALFLFCYGLSALKSACQNKSMRVIADKKKSTRKEMITATLAVTLLNPHVYLDTIVIVGGIAANLNFTQKIYFLIGSLLGSLIWFFGLGYGSKKLTPLFAKPYMWKILDLVIAVIMFSISYQLVKFAYYSLS
nr:LysE/ArgO family amino acid transporter [Phocoenobacter uteri]